MTAMHNYCQDRKMKAACFYKKVGLQSSFSCHCMVWALLIRQRKFWEECGLFHGSKGFYVRVYGQ